MGEYRRSLSITVDLDTNKRSERKVFDGDDAVVDALQWLLAEHLIGASRLAEIARVDEVDDG